MGLNLDSLRFLLQARTRGIHWGRTLTLGRQDVPVGPERLEKLLIARGCWPPAQGVERFRAQLGRAANRAEAFLLALGAEGVSAMDASGYEGAALVHDLNALVRPEWEDAFDVVIDGGTLEHVFNFPIAIANCMRLVKPGGRLFLFTPTNNYCGHGFYQFSPELFYRVLSPANGYHVERMIAQEAGWFMARFLKVKYYFEIRSSWFEVADPAAICKRVTLVNRRPTILMIQAVRKEKVPVLTVAPQQSDYTVLWEQAGAPTSTAVESAPRGVVGWLLRSFGETVCLETLPRLAGWLDPLRWRRCTREQSFRNPEMYRRVKDE
jgi:SAM-dependent methyltransferase